MGSKRTNMGFHTAQDVMKNCPADVKDSAYTVLLVLANLVDDASRFWYISSDGLREKTHLCRKANERGLRELVRRGIVTRQRAAENRPYTYHIEDFNNLVPTALAGADGVAEYSFEEA